MKIGSTLLGVSLATRDSHILWRSLFGLFTKIGKLIGFKVLILMDYTPWYHNREKPLCSIHKLNNKKKESGWSVISKKHGDGKKKLVWAFLKNLTLN